MLVCNGSCHMFSTRAASNCSRWRSNSCTTNDSDMTWATPCSEVETNGHGGGRCSQIKEAPHGWCIAAAMVRRWKWGATEPGSQDKQRTCHAKFALTLGLRNQTTSNNKVLLSSYLSNSLSLLPFLARSLAFCSLSLSIYLPLSFSRCPFPSSRPSSSQQR